jgi:fermentation-respiration switch protein FrsA (DUF1100 family)
MAAYFLHLGQ